MKTRKKIIWAFFGLLLIVVASSFAGPQKALAAESSDGVRDCINNLQFVSIAQIRCGNIIFTDDNPTDDTPNYSPPSGIFCSNDQTYKDGFQDRKLYPTSPNLREGINLNIGSRHLGISDVSAKITATVNLAYPKPHSSDCVPYGTNHSDFVTPPAPKETTKLPSRAVSNTGNILNFLQWSGDGIGSLNGVSHGSLAGKGYNRIVGQDPGNGNFLFQSDDLSIAKCQGTIIAVLPGGHTAKEYSISKGSGGLPQDLSQLLQGSGCVAKVANFGLLSSSTTFGIAGTPPDLTEDSSGTPGNLNSASTTNKSCEASTGSGPFAWIMCPSLKYADSAAGALNDFVEEQLHFCTGTSSTTGVTCQDNNLNDQVKVGWGIMKNVATALLVIVLLIMVISQAVGSERIDAYTVRKMLPRIVAAVILIQLSWVLFKWLIDLSNDAGKAIGDLLFAPFGGESNMSLAKMVGHDVVVATGGHANIFSVFAMLAGAGLLIANIPGLLVMALFVVASLFTAFFVLVLRKVLILMLVILAPIALIAWILPGTERYWKIWRENFTKLLAMFPLIMALIAAGRIFAFIASGGSGSTTTSFAPNLGVAHLGPLPVPYVASVTGFADLAIVLIAFFGPYLLLPKTFQWGGALMGAMTRASEKGLGKLHEKTEKPFREWGERKQGQIAKGYNPKAGLASKTFRRLGSGHYLPTERSRRLTIATGDKWASDRNDEAAALVQRTYEKALTGYDRRMTDENGNYVRVSRNANGKMVDAAGNTVDSWRNANLLYRGDDKTQADIEHITGVEAGKQALVDIAGNSALTDPQKRAAQAAHKQLIDTHSEIELQGARIQGGRYEGKRASEVPTWDDTLINSPQHYSAMTRSRPDMAPDVKEGAEGKVGIGYDAATPAQTRELDKERLKTAIERMTPEGLSNVHYGFFQDIARQEDTELSGQLATMLKHFQENAGLVGANAVGSLRGGKEKYVNQALQAGFGAGLAPGAAGPAAPSLDTL